MSDPVLQVDKLNQFYGESHTLWDVDLDVPEGSCLCLMGRNGVGKTTLLKTVMGALEAKSGQIRLCGHDQASPTERISASASCHRGGTSSVS